MHSCKQPASNFVISLENCFLNPNGKLIVFSPIMIWEHSATYILLAMTLLETPRRQRTICIASINITIDLAKNQIPEHTQHNLPKHCHSCEKDSFRYPVHQPHHRTNKNRMLTSVHLPRGKKPDERFP